MVFGLSFESVFVFFNSKQREIILVQNKREGIICWVLEYLLFHTRNPYYDKPWDYIYFCDLETGKSWEYLFPTCLSCKRGRIELEIDDNGRSEVIHRKEHRVFSSKGVLEDIYLKLQ